MGKCCWPASGSSSIDYFQHSWLYGTDGADIKNTQFGNGVVNWFGANLFLWLEGYEMADETIGSIQFGTHKNYDGGDMDVDIWIMDTDDGSLPNLKNFYAGIRNYDDGDAIDQTLNVTLQQKNMAANNVIYQVSWTLTPQGRATAGKHWSILKLERDDAESGNPILMACTLGYGLA